ncbi:MAG: magnesium transporter [Rhodobacteraceae bacterium]|nr:magnesium transporter [Paracoccaceae bacterium]
MMRLYSNAGGKLAPLPAGSDPAGAAWIDVADPDDTDAAALDRLGISMPSFADMREIEVSSRLFRLDETDYMTVVLTGQVTGQEKGQVTGPGDGTAQGRTARALPVSFILSPTRLITVRHHAPRPFDTYPDHAATSAAGCASPHHIALGLLDEIIGRQADLIEGIGDALDHLLADALDKDASREPDRLRTLLQSLGQQGELLGRVRLALLSIERALSFHRQTHGPAEARIVDIIDGIQHDIRALMEHSASVSERIGFATDLTLGLISVDQNTTMRIFSIVATFFLPPTLIASIYGMNFARMPELNSPWGYPIALAVMAGSAVLAYAIFKWRRWL